MGAWQFVLLLLRAVATGGSHGDVKCRCTSDIVIGGNVMLDCTFSSHLDVLQVTWQRKKNNLQENMATSSRKYGNIVLNPFKERVTVERSSTSSSSLTISDFKKEDETCYICLFNAYPYGSYTGEVCLTIQAAGNEVTCSATGTEVPDISFQPSEIVSSPAQKTVRNKDGTKTTISTGTYLGTPKEMNCTFKVTRGNKRKRDLKENQNNSDEGNDRIRITNCSSSGKTRPKFVWENEGTPFRKEDTESITGDVITVTSTRWHSLASLSDQDEPIICRIILQHSARDYLKLYTHEDSLFIRLILICAAIMILTATLCVYLFCSRRRNKSLETTTPRKAQMNNRKDGFQTPRSSNRMDPEAPVSSQSTPGSSVSKRWRSANIKENDPFKMQLSFEETDQS